MRHSIWILAAALCLLTGLGAAHLATAQDDAPKDPSRVAVVWTSGDPDVAHRMVFMYLHNAQKRRWIDETLLIVWGPSARLLAGDKDLQAKVQAMQKAGVKVQACKACSDSYGVTPALTQLGVEVKYMGVPLSEILKDDGWKVMSF